MFQHRHYVEIARIIAMMDYPGPRSDVAALFASQLLSSNPRFDAERFMRAAMGKRDKP